MTMNPESRIRVALIAAIYGLEAAAVMMLLTLYRTADKPDMWSFFSRLDGRLFLFGSLLFVCMSVLAGWKYGAVLERSGRHPYGAIIKWNIVPVILIVTVAEVTLRLVSIETQNGTVVGGQLLLPRRLERAVSLYTRQTSEAIQYDEYLGWTLRPNVSSKDGLYFVSGQGIRSPRADMAFDHSRIGCRIALVGDSHTFGSELKFEDTWASYLGQYIPSGCQILNFGVGGYSLGQMYLRYLRDVRPWQPNLVILALSGGSAGRTMGVYGLNMFPRHIPWAQPRFQIHDQKLVPINVPLPTEEVLATTRYMSDLPFIEYDWYFVPGNWDQPQWHYLYHSYLFRLYTTWFPIWRHERKGNSEESVNHELLRSFLRVVESDGARAIVMYLPDKTDFEEPLPKETSSQRILRTSGIDYSDLVPCLDKVPASDRFISHGDHYSVSGGTAIAQCIADRIVHTPARLAIRR